MNREEVLQVYAQVNKDIEIKELAKTDLFFLLICVMGRKDMNNDFLFDRCREVQKNPNGYLDLWAREHYKSTIITIGLTIQNILNNPNITIGIFSHTRAIAKEFLKQIKREFETNIVLQKLFPHICKPTSKESRAISRTWSEEKILVKRKKNPKEATLEAWGLVDGQPTGKHFDILIYDDVVTLESVNTPEQIKKTTDAWRLSLNLGARNGVIRMIGTRYHLLDTYDKIIKQGSVIPRIYPATRDGTEAGEPVFLEKENLEKKRRDMGAYVFACQMLQNPKQDKMQSFKSEWLRFWQPELKHYISMNRIILVDPANSKKRNSDYTTMWLVGRNFDEKYYVIRMLRDRLNLSERTRALFELVRNYDVQNVAYEQYGVQADIDHIKSEMQRHCYHFNILPVGGKMAKNDRIKRLETDFEQGNIFLPTTCHYKSYEGKFEDMTQIFINEEYLLFPMSSHDDMLDALARIHDVELNAPKKFEFEHKNIKSRSDYDIWNRR